jgi:hypothetical protein
VVQCLWVVLPFWKGKAAVHFVFQCLWAVLTSLEEIAAVYIVLQCIWNALGNLAGDRRNLLCFHCLWVALTILEGDRSSLICFPRSVGCLYHTGSPTLYSNVYGMSLPCWKGIATAYFVFQCLWVVHTILEGESSSLLCIGMSVSCSLQHGMG